MPEKIYIKGISPAPGIIDMNHDGIIGIPSEHVFRMSDSAGTKCIPDLLEALNISESFLRHLSDQCLGTTGASVLSVVRAAIAKAEGR